MENPIEYKHEPKACPRCQMMFECKVGNVSECQCQAVRLNDEVQKNIQSRYSDCLCANCLKELRREYYVKSFQEKIQRLFRYR